MKKKLCLLLCILIGIISVGCGSGSEEKQTEMEPVVYKIGDTISIDDYAEITFDDLDFRTDTKFGNPDDPETSGWTFTRFSSDYYLGVIGTWKNLSSDPQQLFRTMDVSLEYNDKKYNGELIYYNLFGATEISPDLSEQFELVFPLTEEMYENKGEFNIICNLHELDERGSEIYKDGSMDFKLVDTVILNIK